MNSNNDLPNKIEELETRLMFQDDLIEKLNQAIISQQNDIRRLTKMLEALHAQVEDIQQPNVLDANLETPPPHY